MVLPRRLFLIFKIIYFFKNTPNKRSILITAIRKGCCFAHPDSYCVKTVVAVRKTRIIRNRNIAVIVFAQIQLFPQYIALLTVDMKRMVRVVQFKKFKMYSILLKGYTTSQRAFKIRVSFIVILCYVLRFISFFILSGFIFFFTRLNYS